MFTSSGVNLPFFYLRNNNFCALFQRDKDGSPQVVLNPTKTLAALIAEKGINKQVQVINHDEHEEEEERKRQLEDQAQLLLPGGSDEEIDEDIAKLLVD